MSTAHAGAGALPDVVPSRRRPLNAVWRAVTRHPAAGVAAGLLVVFILVAVLAPIIAPYGVDEKVGRPFEAPSPAHPLGLDDAGHDMLTQMLWGARVSLLVGFAAALVAMLIGGTVGVLSGYFGGKVDTALMRLTDYFLVIPDIPLMLVAAAVWGQSLTNIVVIIGVIYWATMARLIRAQTKGIRERVYVKRARMIGCSHTRVVLRHVLPQLTPLIIAITIMQVAYAIFAETAMAFLGLGDATLTSWGRLIQNAFTSSAISAGAWWALVPPGVAVAIVVLSCTVIGRAVEDSLNPRLRNAYMSTHPFRIKRLQLEDYAK